MKNYKFYDIKKTIKYTLIATSFFGTVFLTGCEKEAINETTTIETVAQTRKPVVVESKIIYETTTPSTTETPEKTTVAPASETTAEQSLEGQVEPETKETDYTIPDEPNFSSAEQLVTYIEKVTAIAKRAVEDKQKEKLELQYEKISMFDWKKNQFEHDQPWGNFKYKDLTKEQKQRVKDCNSIWEMIGKDHMTDVKDSYQKFSSIAVEESLKETIQEKGSEALEKAKEIGGSLIEKAKQKMKK